MKNVKKMNNTDGIVEIITVPEGTYWLYENGMMEKQSNCNEGEFH